MVGFEIWLNGERLGVCGDGALGSLHAIVGFVAKRDELTLNVGGIAHHGPHDDEFLTWLNQRLQPGDRLEVRIVALDEALAPLERRRVPSDLVMQAKRRSLEALRRELEGDTPESGRQ